MRAEHALLLMLAMSPLGGVAQELSEAPSLELLEFLGEWQDGEGNEIDPQALALMQLRLGSTQGGGESDDEK